MRAKLVKMTIGVIAGLALLLGVEIVHAMLGERLPARAPYRLDGRVGGSGQSLRVAWLGDSVAAGVGASGPDAALPRLVARSADRPVDLFVFAVSGERVAGVLEDQVPKLERLDPPADVVIVEIGANDVTHLTGGASFRRSYDRVLARISATGARVVALGLPAFASTPRFLQPLRAIVAWRSRRLDALVRASADAHGADYVDIATATEPRFAADPDGTHAADRFHPNDVGYRFWAEAVIPAVRG